MAVPGRRNGMIGDDDDNNNDVEDGLFEEGLIAEADFLDTPLHLRPLAFASQNGDLSALRQALDIQALRSILCNGTEEGMV